MQAERPLLRKALFRRPPVPFVLAAILFVMFAVLLGGNGLVAPKEMHSSTNIFGVAQEEITLLRNDSATQATALVAWKNGNGQVISSNNYTIPGGGFMIAPAPPSQTTPVTIPGPGGFSYVTKGDISAQVTVAPATASNGFCQPDVSAFVAVGTTTTGNFSVVAYEPLKSLTSGSWGYSPKLSKVSTPACPSATTRTGGPSSSLHSLLYASGEIAILKTTNLATSTIDVTITASQSGTPFSSSTASIISGATVDTILPTPPNSTTLAFLDGKTAKVYSPVDLMVTSQMTPCVPRMMNVVWLATTTPSSTSPSAFNISTVLKYEVKSWIEKLRLPLHDYCPSISDD